MAGEVEVDDPTAADKPERAMCGVGRIGSKARQVRGTEQLLVEKGVLTREEIDRKMADLEPTWDKS